jgi:hypothetical protein
MARQPKPSAPQDLLAAFDRLPVSTRRRVLEALSRRPGVAPAMARVALAHLSTLETVELWQELCAEITPGRPATSALAGIVRGTLDNYWRLTVITNERERQRRSNRPGPQRADRIQTLALQAIALSMTGKSWAEVGQLLHATQRELLSASYQVAHLSRKQKADLGRYLHKVVKRQRQARSRGLL